MKRTLILILILQMAAAIASAQVQVKQKSIFPRFPQTATNTLTGETLILWSDNSGNSFGKIVDKNGSPGGSQIRLPNSGQSGGVGAVAYNPATNEYLVGFNDVAANRIVVVRLDSKGRSLAQEIDETNDNPCTNSQNGGNSVAKIMFNPVTKGYILIWVSNSTRVAGCPTANGFDGTFYAGALLSQKGVKTLPTQHLLWHYGPHMDIAYLPSSNKILLALWASWPDPYAFP